MAGMLMVVVVLLLLLDVAAVVQAGRYQSSVNYLIPRRETLHVLILIVVLMMAMMVVLMLLLLLVLMLLLDQPGMQQIVFRLMNGRFGQLMATGLDDRGQCSRVEFVPCRIRVQINRIGFLVVDLRLTHIAGVVFVQVQHADVGHRGQLRRWRGRIRLDLALSKLMLLLLMHIDG